MMKHSLLIATTFFLYSATRAQGNSITAQYRAIKEVYGDLDKDGVVEKAVVYNMKAEEDEVEGSDREVVIFKKDGAGWRIWHRSTRAVHNSRDGGMMGDPFEDMEIKKGVLLISQAGGSSWKWGFTDKYRYQNNRFELIGHTHHWGKVCEYWGSFDYNVMTGTIVYKKEYERCDEEDRPAAYKKEAETFTYKLKEKVTLDNRLGEDGQIMIRTPKYKEALYL